MSKVLDPFRFLLITVAGWMNEQQRLMIEYLREENRVLREQWGDRRLRFNDEQRIRLAAKAKGLKRKLLLEMRTIVTPDTLRAWHRKLIAQKYDESCQTCAWTPTHGGRDGQFGCPFGARKSLLGLPADSGSAFPFRAQTSAQHNRRYPALARHRARARAQSNDDLEGVSETALGADRRGRFLYC